MSLTDVINPQVGLGLMLCANRWVSLMNLYPKKVTLSLLRRIPWIVNNKYKWEVPLCTWKVLDFTRYFGSSTSTSTLRFRQSSTSSTDKIVLKYKYKYWYLTTTLEHNNILCIPHIPYLYTLTYHNTMINMHWKLSCSDDHMLADFHGQHNHHTDTPAALSKQDVSLETRAKLLDLRGTRDWHHTISCTRESGELTFLDATGNCHRNNCRVFFLVMQTKSGGVPLGE